MTPLHPDDAPTLYFNAPGKWNTGDASRGKWVVGVFNGYITEGMIDAEISQHDRLRIFDHLEEAVVYLQELARELRPPVYDQNGQVMCSHEWFAVVGGHLWCKWCGADKAHIDQSALTP